MSLIARARRLLRLPYHPVVWRLNRNHQEEARHAQELASRLDRIEQRVDRLDRIEQRLDRLVAIEDRRRARPTHLPTCIVYGNCQATSLASILARSRAFTDAYHLLPVAAAHEILLDARRSGPAPVQRLHQAAANASLLLTQQISPGYHGQPLGTEDLTDLLPSDCTTLILPALYHDGFFPYMVYVRIEGEHFHTGAPLVDYHDLRFLYCASQGLTTEQATSWLDAYEPPPDSLRQLASDADARLAHTLDHSHFPLGAVAFDRDQQPRHWYTVNHPTRALLDQIAATIHLKLGLQWQPSEMSELEYGLSGLQAPLEPNILRVLSPGAAPREGWQIRYQHWGIDKLLALHLKFYAERPDVVAAGLTEHAERMRLLELV